MAISPAFPSIPSPQSPCSEPGPSRAVLSPSNKRSASVSLSDSETLVPKTTKMPQTAARSMKSRTAVLDMHRRRRKKKKLSITRNGFQISRLSRATTPGSPKGKECEINGERSSDEQNETKSAPQDSHELVLLRNKLEEQTSLLDAHKEFLTSLAPAITCQICLDPMCRPYTLAPCGHTACYDCLLAWFRAPPGHVSLPPPEHLAHNFDVEEPTLLARDAPMLLRKEKTCPHCRAVVRDAPVEAWGLKDIVHHLFAHKGDVAKDMYPGYNRPQERTQSGADAWSGVFRRGCIPRMLAVPNGNENERAGARNDDGDQVIHPQAFYDEEDDVYRCTDCYHEILNGICSSCGRLYPGLHFDFEDEDEEVDAGRWMDAEEFDGFEGDPIDLDDGHVGPDADVAIRGIMGALGFRLASRPADFRNHGGDEDEDEDEGGYESSFIDDGDDHARMDEYHSAEEDGDYETEDEEMRGNSEDDAENDHMPRRVPPPRVDESGEEAPHVRLGIVELLDSDSDVASLQVNHRGTQRNRNRIDSDDDEEASAGSQHGRHAPGPSRNRRAIINDSDSDQDEDQHLSVPVQRNFRPYARSLSDEGSLSGEGSDHSSQRGSFRGSVSGLSHENYENYAFSDEEDIMWSD